MTLSRTARGLLNTIFRHQWRFLATFGVILALTIAAALVVRPAYRSEALLLVKFNGRAGGADTVASAAIQAQASERREVMNSQAQILRSRDLLRDVVERIGAAALYPALATGEEAGVAKATEQLERDLEIEPTKETNILQVAVHNRVPQVAARALEEIVSRFQARQSELFLNPQSTFLREQLDEARRQLGQSQAAVEAFKAQSGISSLDEERTLLLRLRAEVRNNLAQLGGRASEAEGRVKMLSQSLKRLPSTIQLSDENDRFKGLDDARARLTELRARETEMKSNYRDDSVALRSLRAQIEFAENDLAERSRDSLARVRTGPNPVHQQVQADLYRASAEAAAAVAAIRPLEQQASQVEARLASLDANQGKLQDLMLQQQVDEESFRSILQRSEDARAAEALQRQQVTSVVVVQQPTLPTRPAKPRVLVILALGTLAGLAIAFAVCLFWELADQTFSLPEQVTTVLRLPVLASFAVNPALTPRSIR